jgi:succinoglycan biosynthesis protein ExoA
MRTIVVVPALNEELYIRNCLHSLLVQEPPIDAVIVVADGGSTDSTCDIVREISRVHPQISLWNNPSRLQSAAVNMVAREAKDEFDVLIRVDAHAGYPPHFISSLHEAYQQSGAASVVVPMIAKGKSCLQRAIAAAQNSILGNGGSLHRRVDRSRFVDHGHHALLDLATFLSLGGYDEGFSHNEDAELDRRIVANGARIWLCAEAAIEYYPRTSLRALSAQYARHGRGRARTLIKHHQSPKLRQIAPGLILAGLLGSIALSAVDPRIGLLACAYALLCLAYGIALGVQQRDRCVTLSGVAAMVMHVSWGFGASMQFLAHTRERIAGKLRQGR